MSTSVRGGVNETGSPFLNDKCAFNIFTISSYVSFYVLFSLIAVVLFLSVLTSAYNKSACVGFNIVYSFYCDRNYFILRDKLNSAAFPAYIRVCMLVIFFAITEFPLYFQLAWATFKKMPKRKCRTYMSRKDIPGKGAH
ncbi:hypothetical protein CFP56_043712 [Quercus suber]|uniref:Uncharacterized protein n=1 Tax=Quercus suber TaxID=58331 RepID=A0AAW0IPP6_QUESU